MTGGVRLLEENECIRTCLWCTEIGYFIPLLAWELRIAVRLLPEGNIWVWLHKQS